MHIRTVFSVNQGQTITRRSDQRCLQNQLCRLLVELHWRNWKRFNTRRKEHVRNVELCKSGSNIASHAWTNNHKIDFNGKIIDKGNFRHRRTLESWHTACTKNSDNNSKHLPHQYRFLLGKEL